MDIEFYTCPAEEIDYPENTFDVQVSFTRESWHGRMKACRGVGASMSPETEEVRKYNPDLKCCEPPYEFCEFPDGEYKESDVLIRHVEAVAEMGVDSENIKFQKLNAAKVLSIYHKGSYDEIGEAYAFIMKYAEEDGYKVCGLSRECYIDGIWNKESVEDWITEVQLPIE